MNPIFAVLIGMVVVLAALVLDQIWFNLLSFDLFAKSSITILIVGAVLFFVYLARRDHLQESEMKKDKYLD